MNALATAAAKKFSAFHSISKHPKMSKEAKAGYLAALVYSDRRAPAVLQEMQACDLVVLLAEVLA